MTTTNIYDALDDIIIENYDDLIYNQKLLRICHNTILYNNNLSYKYNIDTKLKIIENYIEKYKKNLSYGKSSILGKRKHIDI